MSLCGKADLSANGLPDGGSWENTGGLDTMRERSLSFTKTKWMMRWPI
jgi:hypothetical protein